MIEVIEQYGHALWIVLSLAIVAVVLYKTYVEGSPSPSENEALLASTEPRSKSFLMTDRSVSKVMEQDSTFSVSTTDVTR